MALFSKKSGDAGAAAAPGAAPKKSGISFGRKKKDAAADAPDASGLELPADGAGFEDFSDFSTPASSEGTAAVVAPPRKATKARILNGTNIGLNIGNDSIKVVELQAKGGDIAVTAMGIAHTPAESISNGVIMSVGALEGAIRDLLKQAGIKSKKATISVQGTGALVVRVIEVPKMTDEELAKNMKVDADRYIPFPPSEVIMDFKALRELPSDPDSPNMDVLLAAAQSEVINLHVQVAEDARLDPRAIDVEPLAAARALTQTLTKQAQSIEAQNHSLDMNGHGSNGHLPVGEVDYKRVSAIINIGSSGTEISVLRGDILVFTRTVPNGGNSLTQSLVDYMGLPWHDAERVKREWGDALPPQQAATSYAAPDATGNDWSEFDSTDAATTASPADPFDPAFFDQGPTQNEPPAPHAQKEGETDDKADAFDFSNFSFADEPTPTPDPIPTTTPATEAPATTETAAVATDDPFNFAFPGDATDAATPATSATAAASAPDATASAWSLDDLGLPAETATTTPAASTSSASGTGATVGASDAFDFNLPDEPSIATTDATLPAANQPATEDFDIDSFFGAGPTAAPVSAPSAALGGAALGSSGLGGVDLGKSGADVPDLNFGALQGDSFDNDMSGFGSGLTADLSTNVDAATVYSILSPLLDELASEIRRSLEYHASRYPDAVVQSIQLIGGGAKLKNIDLFLTQTLGIPTTIGNPLHRLSIRTPQLPETYATENGPIFAVAAGLALRDLIG